MSEPRTSLVVPLMKARVPAEVQLEFPLPADEVPIREPFVGDLYVTYALELPGERPRYEHVAARHCAEWGIAPGELRRLAPVNLRNLRPDLRMSWYPDVRAVSVTQLPGDGLESGLLLDEGLLEKLAQDVDGDLVVAVPARDVVVASGTGHPDGIDKLRWAVDRVWSGGREEDGPDAWNVPSGQLLTRDLLVWRGGDWVLL